ncbi:MAG: GTP-binding protein [Planctomycetota bacterium]
MTGKRKRRIPTNIITGFLGSGKTTAIAKLIERRKEDEKWSIFVNEFGSVSIDHALVDSHEGKTEIQELAGGCACCTQASAFQPLLAQFIRRSKPDRLILEPSGAGHPAGIVDILRNDNFSGALDLRNIICLIDPNDFQDVQKRETLAFQDQIQLADIVLLNWTDSRDRETIDRCREWLEGMKPPKQHIAETSFGEMDPELLDRKFGPSQLTLSILDLDSTKAGLVTKTVVSLNSLRQRDSPQPEEADARQEPTPRNPLRFQNADSSMDAFGWIFDVDDVFDRTKLLDLFASVRSTLRLKGVFHCDDDWWSINQAKDEVACIKSAYRRDSRLEIIAGRGKIDWADFELEFLKCLAD